MGLFEFWIMKPIAEFAFGFMLFAFAMLVLLIVQFPALIKQFRCKHDGGVTETWACDAICKKCGKNLGFIGAWRENNKR